MSCLPQTSKDWSSEFYRHWKPAGAGGGVGWGGLQELPRLHDQMSERDRDATRFLCSWVLWWGGGAYPWHNSVIYWTRIWSFVLDWNWYYFFLLPVVLEGLSDIRVYVCVSLGVAVIVCLCVCLWACGWPRPSLACVWTNPSKSSLPSTVGVLPMILCRGVPGLSVRQSDCFALEDKRTSTIIPECRCENWAGNVSDLSRGIPAGLENCFPVRADLLFRIIWWCCGTGSFTSNTHEHWVSDCFGFF